MQKSIRLCIIVISILMFLLTGCSDNNKEVKADNSVAFNSLIEKVISIQYGNKDIKETDIFSKEYIDKIPKDENFYKDKLNPYRILSSNIEETKSDTEEKFEVCVRIADKEGEYIQVLHMIKINERYFVDNIEYDI